MTALDQGELDKYYSQRYRLFSRFDQGIQLDRVGWFSATAERIAERHAERLLARSERSSSVVIDLFAGTGSNAIQLAVRSEALALDVRVIAVEIDAPRLALARHNAAVYGVSDRIEFVCADAVALLRDAAWPRLAPHERVHAVFLSPPWGGPAYLDSLDAFSLRHVLIDGGHSLADVVELVRRRLTLNVALFLPRTTDRAEIAALVGTGNLAELEQHRLSGKLKALTVYLGGLVDTQLAVAHLNV